LTSSSNSSGSEKLASSNRPKSAFLVPIGSAAPGSFTKGFTATLGPGIVLNSFEQSIPQAKRDVPKAGGIGPAHAHERIPLDVDLELPGDADAQVGLDSEELLGRLPGEALSRKDEPRLELQGAARDEPRALGHLRAIGLDLGDRRRGESGQ
jgi:hypothetical protein